MPTVADSVCANAAAGSLSSLVPYPPNLRNGVQPAGLLSCFDTVRWRGTSIDTKSA